MIDAALPLRQPTLVQRATAQIRHEASGLAQTLDYGTVRELDRRTRQSFIVHHKRADQIDECD